MRSQGEAQNAAGRHGHQGGRDAELWKPLAGVSRTRGAEPRRCGQHPELEPAPGAAQRGPLRGGRFHGAGAELAAGAEERDAVPRGGHRHALLLRLVGAPVLRDGGSCCWPAVPLH